MEAVGTYLRTLRDAHGLTRTDVAAEAGTNESQVQRIEAGEIDTRSSLLMRFVQAVAGNPYDVYELSVSNEATAEDGRARAQAWLSQPEHDMIRQEVQSTSRAELEALVAVIQRHLEERGVVLKIDGFGLTPPAPPPSKRPWLKRRQRRG